MLKKMLDAYQAARRPASTSKDLSCEARRRSRVLVEPRWEASGARVEGDRSDEGPPADEPAALHTTLLCSDWDARMLDLGGAVSIRKGTFAFSHGRDGDRRREASRSDFTECEAPDEDDAADGRRAADWIMAPLDAGVSAQFAPRAPASSPWYQQDPGRTVCLEDTMLIRQRKRRRMRLSAKRSCEV
mmetsp:Transcript_34413/g.97508  ORF Transcript_34413/g.97508 Transcript_34413/m.97508 type:complete len:187 (+) Transcript_34413:1632-2192(+)